jgi:transposase
MSNREISRRLNVTRNTVHDIIDQKGIMPEIIRQDKIKIDQELLHKLYNDCNGYIKRIHKKLIEEERIEIGYSTLTIKIRELGISRSKFGLETKHLCFKYFDKTKINEELQICMVKGKSYLNILRKIIYNDDNKIEEKDFLLTEDERQSIIKNAVKGNKRLWRYGIVTELFGLGAGIRAISNLLDMSRDTVGKIINEYNQNGFESILNKCLTKSTRKETVIKTQRIIEILHQKPNLFGINRSNWNRESIKNVYENKYGEKIGNSTVGCLINNAGYKIKKVKQVLTSPDPNYREKVELLLKTIQSLKSDEMFFFLDELGPLRVKKYGGRCYIKKGEILRVPKVQTLKGSITLFGALSATTNQLSWNFGKSKDTSAMIDLIEILYNQYYNKSKIYITWDAVSWHNSNKLLDWLDNFNAETKDIGEGPLLEFIPLPTSAQFLNVIESIFSGMKRAVVHHSDYQSEAEMKFAISGHFVDRNAYFKENPKRAGKKIWEIDFFLDYNNMKFGNYREY